MNDNFCKKCGKSLELNNNFCVNCGDKTNLELNSNNPHNIKTTKKKSSKKKKIVIVVIVLLLFVVFMSLPSDERYAVDEVAYSDPVFFDGTYDDLLRNEYEHKGKIVKVSGTVTTVNESYSGYDTQVWSTSTLQMNTQFSKYVDYPIRLLNGDNVSGYGIYQGICGQNLAGDPYTCFTHVKLETIDFRTLADDICDDPIAIQFGLC